MRIADMNWMQVEAYLKDDDRCILPLGSTEQHAYLSLSVDSILSEKVSLDAADPVGVPVFPVLAYGMTPLFKAYPGTISISMRSYIAILEDILTHLKQQGFRRVLIVNGHGGNSPASHFVGEWQTNHTEMRIQWHDWWRAKKTMKQVRKTDAIGSHASWMENFPWTRLEGVSMPDVQKKMVDFKHLQQLSPDEAKDYLSDGNFGGVYQHDDASMQKIWEIAVAETRDLLVDGWVQE